ncbi:MAG: hypothetical protein FWE07_05155 [Turicibacter sp.]|nr:hypothetical protein [Turicibacter sp.]
MKKIMYLMTLLSIAVLMACTNDNTDLQNEETGDTPTNEEATTGSDTNDSTDVLIDTDILAELPEFIPHIVPRGRVSRFGEYLALMDLLTGDVLTTYELEDGEIVVNVFNFDNGYFGALIGMLDPLDLYFDLYFAGLTDDDFDLMAVIDAAEEHDYQLRYLILDQQLNVLETLPITSEPLQDANLHIFNLVVYEQGELFVYHVPNYLFHGSSGANIYRYNVHTNVDELLFQMDHRINIHNMALLESGDLAFIGGRLTVNMYELGPLMYYGVINLETNEMTLFNEYGFRHEAITSGGLQMLITEGVQIELIEDSRSEGAVTTDRDEVILIDTGSMTQAFVSLPELESAFSQLSQCGQYLMTINADRTYFKQYEIINGTSVSLNQQIPLQLGNASDRVTVFSLTDTIFAIHYLTVSPEGNSDRRVEIIQLLSE